MLPVTVLPLGMMPTNCYLIEKNGAAAVIDPGAEGERIVSLCRERGLRVEGILLTHGHFDHIGGLAALLAAFPKAPVYIGAPDAPCLADAEASLGLGRPGFVQPQVPAPHLLADGDTLSVGALHFRALATPGHTRGSMSFLCEDALFSGDTLFAGDCGRVDLPGGSAFEMGRSLQRLAALPGDYAVYPGHEEGTTLEAERHNNYALQRFSGILPGGPAV